MTRVRQPSSGHGDSRQGPAFSGAGFDGPFYPGADTGGLRYWLHDGLDGAIREHVTAHEVGHVISTAAAGPKGIPLTGAEEAFAVVFHLQNAPGKPSRSDPPKRRTRPEGQGFKSEEAHAEMMAEAIRLYMQAPEYIKEYFPDAARRIRQYVNTNPQVNRIIQFN